MEKRIVILILSATSILSVLALHYYSQWRLQKHYNFHRTIKIGVLSTDTIIDLKRKGNYFAGTRNGIVYTAHPSVPLKIIRVQKSKLDTLTIKGASADLVVTEILIDSPFIYVTDPVQYSLYLGSSFNLMIETKIINHTFFSEVVPISTVSWALRTIEPKAYEYRLEKKSSIIYLNGAPSGLLQKQIDGLFCTDGKLHYNKSLNRLIYLYFYRNEFIVMDTSLNLEYRGHTIDPIDSAKIEVAEIKSENALKLSSPPLIVNKQSAVQGQYLYINSGVASLDDDLDVFDDVSVIDVYDLYSKTYQYSFYINDFQGEPVTRFIVDGHKLATIQGSYLTLYDLNLHE